MATWWWLTYREKDFFQMDVLPCSLWASHNSRVYGFTMALNFQLPLVPLLCGLCFHSCCPLPPYILLPQFLCSVLMQCLMVWSVWHWCSDLLRKDLSQPPCIVVSMKVDNAAVELECSTASIAIDISSQICRRLVSTSWQILPWWSTQTLGTLGCSQSKEDECWVVGCAVARGGGIGRETLHSVVYTDEGVGLRLLYKGKKGRWWG